MMIWIKEMKIGGDWKSHRLEGDDFVRYDFLL